MSRRYATLLVITFGALICLPGLSLAIWRSPQPLPKVRPVEYPSFEPTVQWLSSLEKYFTANFGHKRRLVQLHNALGYFVLGDLRSPNVLAGREGWLFLKQSFGWRSFRSEAPMRQQESAEWLRAFKAAKKQLDERKIPLLYVIVPSKETVHPEFLPASAIPVRSAKRADEMVPLLQAAGIHHLDLRGPLRAAARAEPLYDKLDSHWNGRGAEHAARLLLEGVAALLHLPPEYAQLSSRLAPGPSPNDLGELLALDDYLREESVLLLPVEPRARRLEPPPTKSIVGRPRRLVFEAPDETLPRALILRDSFGTMLVPALAEKFRRSVWLWTREFDFSVLERERPDIVIFEITERLFHDRSPRLISPRKRR